MSKYLMKLVACCCCYCLKMVVGEPLPHEASTLELVPSPPPPKKRYQPMSLDDASATPTIQLPHWLQQHPTKHRISLSTPWR